MPHSLPAILAHVRAQGRPGSHQAVLVREIERLQAEVAAEFRRGIEAAAAIADIYEVENFRLCTDTILTDPVLNGTDCSPDGCAVSERLQSDAIIHSSMAHAARNIAEAIRGATKETSDV
jgi:hypothetical protein